MNYDGLEYSWVNEKVIGGVLYSAFRCNDDPKKCLIVSDDGSGNPQTAETVSLKDDWLALDPVEEVVLDDRIAELQAALADAVQAKLVFEAKVSVRGAML